MPKCYIFRISKGFPYWAIIFARSKYEAVGLYVTEVCNLDEEINLDRIDVEPVLKCVKFRYAVRMLITSRFPQITSCEIGG